MGAPYQDRVCHATSWTLVPDPRAPSLRARNLADPWEGAQRVQRVELQEDADGANAWHAKPKEYSADDVIARIGAH
eukprot:7579039-Pyramimonas_sp.AAC.1